MSVIAAATVTTSAVADDFKAGIVTGHPAVFRWVRHLQETLVPEVHRQLQASGHQFEFTEYFGGSLAPVGGELEAIEEGLAEIGTVHAVFDPAKLPLQNITYYAPFVSPSTDIILPLMDKLNKTEPALQREWQENGLEYLAALGVDDYLLMTNFPIVSISDLVGRKIGAPGPAANWLEGTGAVAVSGNFSSYYNDIKSGVFDGAIVFATAALPAKLYEVAPYITPVGFGAQFTGAIVANRSWFDALPPSAQSALRQAASAYTNAYEKDLRSSAAASLASMQNKGAKMANIDSEFRQQWVDGMSNIARAWAEKLDQQGQPGSQLLKRYLAEAVNAGATPLRNWQ